MSDKIKNTEQSGNDTIHSVSGSFDYGCPQCGSKNVKEIGNNHDKTDDEMEYLEFYKCLNCGYEFVE